MANINTISPDGGTTVYDIEDTPARSSVNSLSSTVGILGSKVSNLESVTLGLEDDIDHIEDSLGTASAKNSTSVVTDSSDLVESGAVKDIVGWGNKNLADNNINTSTVLAGVTLALNPDKTITLNGTSASSGARNCCVFLGSYLKSKGNTLYVSGGVANKAYIALRNDSFSYAKVSRGDTVPIDTSELLDDATYYITLGIEASGIDETGVVIKPMLSKEKSGSYEPYHASVEESLDDKMSYADNGVLGAKNLLPNNAVSSGIFTVDDDKSITVNGTVSVQTWCFLNITNHIVKKGRYTLSGCPSGGEGGAKFYLKLSLSNTEGGSEAVNASDYGKGVTFDVPNDMYVRSYSGVVIQANATVSNKTFYPMLKLATDTDPTYQSPTQTNRELTVNKADNSIIAPHRKRHNRKSGLCSK